MKRSVILFCALFFNALYSYEKECEFPVASASYLATRADEIVVTRYTPAKLYKYKEGILDEEFGQGGNFAGVAIDSAGRIIAADSGYACVRIFTPEGSSQIGGLYPGKIIGNDVDYSHVPNDQFLKVVSVAIDPRNDNILVLSDEIKVFNSQGEFLFKFGKFATPYDLAVDPLSGHIVVTEGIPSRGGAFKKCPRLKIFDEQGKLLKACMDEGMPLGVAIDSSGNIFVADIYNKRVQLLDPEGNFLLSFGKFDFGPLGVALDSQERVAVGDLVVNSHYRVQIYR